MSETTAAAAAAAAAVPVPAAAGPPIGRFTEAVPLSLSSVAHTSIPLEDGVLDGLKTIIQHTLWSSLSYARAAFGRNFSPVDLSTSLLAWTPRGMCSKAAEAGGEKEDEIPMPLRKKHGFIHSYQRTALIYLRPAMSSASMSKDDEDTYSEHLLQNDNWTQEPGVLAKITLLYASTEELTPEELDVASYDNYGDDGNIKQSRKSSSKKRSSDEISVESGDKFGGDSSSNNDNDDDDEEPSAPPPPKHVIMYRAMIEYRSLPATGNVAAVRAEELSMLSFGGSLVDDDVKLGALASLYDDNGKYVLEIFGVRGKKYRLDLMDATLSDGTVPTLPTRNITTGVGGGTSGGSGGVGRRRRGIDGAAPIPHDPFVKTLCVTVTDHEPTGCINAAKTTTTDDEDMGSPEEKKATGGNSNSNNNNTEGNPSFALTKMRFTLEGDLRISDLLNVTDLPAPNYYPDQIQKTFLSLRSQQPSSSSPQNNSNNKKKSTDKLQKQSLSSNGLDVVVGTPSGHRLLLHPSEAGKVYIHGRYVTTWGKDKRIGSSVPALFGMDLHSVPYFHGRITDYDRLMIAYATLWAEILTDAKLVSRNTGGRLLSRLITGNDPFLEEDEEDSDSDDDDDLDDDDEEEDTTVRVNTAIGCLESQVMSSSKCDPVGIAAKALATQFQYEYGMEGYPCLAHEMDWVKNRLPGRVPVVVPQRLIDVLRRGGYFDVKRTSDEIWFAQTESTRPAKDIGTDAERLVERTCELLVEAKCNDVQPSSIVFGKIAIENPVQKKGLVRINRLSRQYRVNEEFLTIDLNEIRAGDSMIMDDDDDEKVAAKEEGDESNQKEKRTMELAFLLGLYIAREHPDGNVLIRYMLQHGKMS
ncbi:MAG: hypothetical protein ACI8RD_007365 [Bacillariaceae sp.]|jgi:hypothetical protein